MDKRDDDIKRFFKKQDTLKELILKTKNTDLHSAFLELMGATLNVLEYYKLDRTEIESLKIESKKYKDNLEDHKLEVAHKIKTEAVPIATEIANSLWEKLDNVSKLASSKPRYLGFLLLLLGKKAIIVINKIKTAEQTTKDIGGSS